MRDLSSSLGVWISGLQALQVTHGQPQAVLPGLSFPGLLCGCSPPTLPGVNRSEELWTPQMKEAGEAAPDYYPLSGQAWEQRLAAFILFQPQESPQNPSVLAAQTGSKAQSLPSQCHFGIDFPKLNYSTAQTTSVLPSPWWFSNILQVSILSSDWLQKIF